MIVIGSAESYRASLDLIIYIYMVEHGDQGNRFEVARSARCKLMMIEGGRWVRRHERYGEAPGYG